MHGEARMKFAVTCMKHACFLRSFSSRVGLKKPRQFNFWFGLKLAIALETWTLTSRYMLVAIRIYSEFDNVHLVHGCCNCVPRARRCTFINKPRHLIVTSFMYKRSEA